MDKRVINGKLHIYEYNGIKGAYKICHLKKKAYFVTIKNKERGQFIERVNFISEKPYILYIGEYTIINDIIII